MRLASAALARVTAAAALVLLALGLGAGPALAHDVLVLTVPAAGSHLDVAPDRVQLVFAEPVDPRFASVAVTGPDDALWSRGGPSVVDGTVTAQLVPLGPAGTYRVSYRVVSADGHPVSGTSTFVLDTAGAAGATPASPPVAGAVRATRAQNVAGPITIGLLVVAGTGLLAVGAGRLARRSGGARTAREGEGQ